MEGMDPSAQIDKSTPYTAIDVAKEFLLRAQKDKDAESDITNMKLNKLVYFAQLASVCLHNRALHLNDTHAWDYGPVVPRLYRLIKEFGPRNFTLSDSDIAKKFADAKAVDDKILSESIDFIWEKMKRMTAVQLSMLTHRRGSPWEIVYNRNRYGIIPLELMREKKFGDRRG